MPEGTSVAGYLRNLVIFLKDFCTDAWQANNRRKKENEERAKTEESILERLSQLEGRADDIEKVLFPEEEEETNEEQQEEGGE